MPDTKESMQESKQAAGALADALQDLLRQLIDRIVGTPTQGRGGEPLRDVCYLVMPMGEPIDPRDVSFPWDPSGGSSSGEIQDDGKFGAAEAQAAAQPAPATPPATPAPDGAGTPATPPPPQIDIKLQHAFMAARKTAEKFDRMLRVTSDGSYRTSRIGGGKVSSAYEAVITKAQGIPAPPPPEIQKQIDEAMRILYVFDENGKQKGKTKEFKNYQMLKEAYADAEAEYANANSAAMTNAALGQSWPVTSKPLRARVDNAYDDWRSARQLAAPATATLATPVASTAAVSELRADLRLLRPDERIAAPDAQVFAIERAPTVLIGEAVDRRTSIAKAVFAFVMLFQMFELTLSYRSTQPLRRCLQFMPVE